MLLVKRLNASTPPIPAKVPTAAPAAKPVQKSSLLISLLTFLPSIGTGRRRGGCIRCNRSCAKFPNRYSQGKRKQIAPQMEQMGKPVTIRAMPDLAVSGISAAISTDIFVLHRKCTGKSGRVLDESPTFLDSACHTKRAISD